MKIRHSSFPNILPLKIDTHRKNNSEVKFPKINQTKSKTKGTKTVSPTSSIIIYKSEHYKQLINSFKEKLKQLQAIRKLILREENMFLVRKIEEEIRYMQNGKRLVSLWENPEILLHYSYREIRLYEKDEEFDIDEELIHGISKVIKMCRIKLGEFKSKSWEKMSIIVGEDRSKLKDEILKVKLNLGKVSDQGRRKQLVKDIKNIQGEILAAKLIYTEWRQRAVRFLEKGNVRCEILRAELDSQKERKF